MKLTKDVVICIELVNKLKGKTTPSKVQALAEEMGTTFYYLSQLQSKLRDAGITAVKHGPGGGIVLKTQDPVSVLQIFQACGKDFKYNKETREGQILEKVESLLKSENC